ncbi:hypothetical protein, partial [Streptomyces sp. NPDC001815]|uniref:hypothetical protein n=1 Tax=unclassified Streptomyces TaxID=2593676 RepID=UPI003318CDC2
MYSRNRENTTRAEQSTGIRKTVHSVLADAPTELYARQDFFKGTSTHHKVMDGVSTYLALIFGTLLSSQGTDASFVLTLSGFPPGASLR